MLRLMLSILHSCRVSENEDVLSRLGNGGIVSWDQFNMTKSLPSTKKPATLQYQ